MMYTTVTRVVLSAIVCLSHWNRVISRDTNVVEQIKGLNSLENEIETESKSNPAPPHNFIIMLMDDMGWGDMGVYGEPNKETPHLDQMAYDGMLLPNFYSACPVCSPSRASLLTGRLPIRNGFYTNNSHGMNSYTHQGVAGGITQYEILLPQLLKKAGYRTKIVGKWHLGHQAEHHPLKHGFDEYFGFPNSHTGPYNGVSMPNIPVYRNEDMIGRLFENIPLSSYGVSNLTEWFVQEALSYIKEQTTQKRPFFLYWAADATHAPTYVSEAFRGTSPRGLFGDAMRELDSGVGRILKLLRDLKIDNNTMVVISSDNGAATYLKSAGGSNGPFLCGKLTTFEGGIREPTIAWWPSVIPPGSISGQVGSMMDLYTTVLDFAGISPPKDRYIDGISLRNTFTNNTITDRAIFSYRGNELMAVRHGNYKAHLWTWTNAEEAFKRGIDFCPGEYVEGVTTHEQTNHTLHPILFDLARDPGEKYPITVSSFEYNAAIARIREIVALHESTMEKGVPQMNTCDPAAMNWSPPGCEKIGMCLPVPESRPYPCYWAS